MTHCICGRTFMTPDGANQHMKGTKKKGTHKLKTEEEVEAERKQRWKETGEKFSKLALELDIRQFNEPFK